MYIQRNFESIYYCFLIKLIHIILLHLLLGSDEFRDHSIVNQTFYTFDHDNAVKCSAQCGSGWWYRSCTTTNLNAPFNEIHRDSVWYNVISSGKFLQFSEMLVKRSVWLCLLYCRKAFGPLCHLCSWVIIPI